MLFDFLRGDLLEERQRLCEVVLLIQAFGGEEGCGTGQLALGKLFGLCKQRCEAAIQNGAKGVRILLSGRLGGAEMARKFDTRLGSIPLSTLQANVDYACVPSHTTYGTIGVKVWLYHGRYGEEVLLTDESRGGRRDGRRGKRG